MKSHPELAGHTTFHLSTGPYSVASVSGGDLNTGVETGTFSFDSSSGIASLKDIYSASVDG